jgi:DNA polymerase lambda
MHEAVLAGPKRNARQRGAVVLERFDRHDDPSTFPTHFVIGSIQSRESVVRVLGFHTLLELQRFLYDHGIWCVSRSWAVQTSTEAYAPPRPGRPGQPGDLYARILPLAPPKLKRTQPAAHFSSRNSDANLMAKSAAAAVPKRNTDLAAVFTQLSKAYQKAPLDPIDSWRSYTFNIAAGRLQALPFDVTSSSLTRLSSIKGFGSSVLAIVEEYVQQQQDDDEEDEEDVEEGTANENARRRPTIGRLQEIQTNPQRQVLREFMRIWGVGRVKALELIKAGYTTIAEIRNDYCTNQLRVSLERNQYIGLLCYEDLLEKMSSEEVERIGAIVQEAVQERFAQASVTIMGSYRRNKGSYGDVDILITHPAHDKNVPPKALGRIIDQLRAANHIAYHLTQLAGMDTDAYETLPADAVRALQLSPVTAKRGKDTSSSYMGVFFSPMVAGKMRRVDIKFYPYSERIFASLYFTGNGHFNRSMRLWATRKHGYKLSDHGLFMRGVDNVRVLEPSNEAQVFYRLGLVYKEPHERDGFDAVLGEDSRRFFDLETWTSDEFRHEEHGHAWID